MTRRQPPATRRKAILDAAATLLPRAGIAGGGPPGCPCRRWPG